MLSLLRQGMSTATPHILGIDPKMYRHFAMITIAISTVVAVFANGETQEAIARNDQHTEMKQAEVKRFGKAKIGDNRSADAKRGSGGFRGTFGEPMDGTSSPGGNSSYVPASMALGPMPIVIEVDRAALAKMSPEQRKAYLKALEEERQRRMREGPFMPSREQVSSLAAISAARSGSNEID